MAIQNHFIKNKQEFPKGKKMMVLSLFVVIILLILLGLALLYRLGMREVAKGLQGF